MTFTWSFLRMYDRWVIEKSDKRNRDKSESRGETTWDGDNILYVIGKSIMLPIVWHHEHAKRMDLSGPSRVVYGRVWSVVHLGAKWRIRRTRTWWPRGIHAWIYTWLERASKVLQWSYMCMCIGYIPGEQHGQMYIASTRPKPDNEGTFGQIGKNWKEVSPCAMHHWNHRQKCYRWHPLAKWLDGKWVVRYGKEKINDSSDHIQLWAYNLKKHREGPTLEGHEYNHCVARHCLHKVARGEKLLHHSKWVPE